MLVPLNIFCFVFFVLFEESRHFVSFHKCYILPNHTTSVQAHLNATNKSLKNQLANCRTNKLIN